jgi:dTDP-4-amino-4,6-dideoxygalactose transaminase
MSIAFVDLAAVHEEIGEELEAAVLEVIRAQRFVGGPQLGSFEQAFAQFLGTEHVIGCANGTDAIELALRALGIGAGDEVLVPANTFIATAEAVARTGATTRFVDVRPENGLIDLDSCADRVRESTRAVIPVHLYGRMVEMGPMIEFAREHGLRVIEDAAQAHGARRDGKSAGTVGDAGCFSFYPGKNLGAFGDAGAIAARDQAVADRLRLMRDHGRRGRDTHEIVGVNSRLDSLQAAVLEVKLTRIAAWNDARRAAAARYRELLPDEIVDTPTTPPEADVHHLFPILVDDREALAEKLADQGIATGVHYRAAVNTTPAFADGADACPVAEDRARRQLSLPMHPHLREADVERVAQAVLRSDA